MGGRKGRAKAKRGGLARQSGQGQEVRWQPRLLARCQHRWVIDAPNGLPTSTGICKRCGGAREFSNSWEDVRREPS